MNECDVCGGNCTFDDHCGARICDDCGHHKGLTRCFCGWSETGEDGREELLEMGEYIDDDY